MYPIVFYSYYNKIGNPGTVSGSLQTTPEKVKNWNASPPNSLSGKTLPSWKNITIANVTATGTKGYSIVWGLALDGFFIENVRLNNVRLADGPGFGIFNATDLQFLGDTDVGRLVISNALAITRQPQNLTVAAGGTASYTIAVAGASGVRGTAPAFQWSLNGTPLADGPRPDGAVISGATTATLRVDKVQSAEAGKYTVTVTNNLDAFDLAANELVPGKTRVTVTSAGATLAVVTKGRLDARSSPAGAGGALRKKGSHEWKNPH
jgi:hypothetical protein